MSSIPETNAGRVGFVSLGCPKALVDSERIMTELRNDGYQIVGSYEEAGLVVVNTCGFIDSAKAESLQAISEALDENGRVIVTGCMGTGADDLEERFPNLLAVTGPQAYAEVVGAVREALPSAPPVEHQRFIDLVPQGVKLTPPHYAYLKISEGCNHRCSFCIIPSLRGDLVSRPVEDVLAEAERLANAGVQELLVISQDTSAYGVDTKYRTGFWNGRPVKARMTELCEALGDLGIWVRLHYVYPYPHVDEVIPLMAQGRLLPYLDIPFQHANTRILKAMKRPAATEKTLDRIAAWRAECPDLSIRSTFIVGFPGETDAEFEELLAFLSEAQLDRVGAFAYSPVAGAPANDLAGPVPEALKQERLERFMAHQAAISAARLQAKIGTEQEVMVDEFVDGACVGRSRGDAPEIDGRVHIDTLGHELHSGERLMVQVTGADEHDLFAQVMEAD